jgi:hypothetical protein
MAPALFGNQRRRRPELYGPLAAGAFEGSPREPIPVPDVDGCISALPKGWTVQRERGRVEGCESCGGALGGPTSHLERRLQSARTLALEALRANQRSLAGFVFDQPGLYPPAE